MALSFTIDLTLTEQREIDDISKWEIERHHRTIGEFGEIRDDVAPKRTWTEEKRRALLRRALSDGEIAR